MEFLLGVVIGFALGYGVREAISRRRRARARRESGRGSHEAGATAGNRSP
jgi:hypothetical protein